MRLTKPTLIEGQIIKEGVEVRIIEAVRISKELPKNRELDVLKLLRDYSKGTIEKGTTPEIAKAVIKKFATSKWVEVTRESDVVSSGKLSLNGKKKADLGSDRLEITILNNKFLYWKQKTSSGKETIKYFEIG